MGVTDKVRVLVEPLLAEEGLALFDIEYGGGRLVVLADREGGVDLEALTRATHRISAALDEHDPIPGGRYLLEVSSPGLERRLRTPEHYRRYVGSLVSIKTLATVEGDRRIRGILTAADARGVTVEDRMIPYTDIERAQTVFEWGPAPKPGKPDAKKATRRPRDAEAGSAPSTSTDPSDPRDQKAPAS